MFQVKGLDKTGDDYFAVENGEKRHPTREEFASEYDRYLTTTTFTEYRDLQQPVVGFSKDGSVAWLIVQIKVAGRDQDEPGKESDFDLTCAWITLSSPEPKNLSAELIRDALEKTYQEGDSLTVYSNIYDLRKGMIHVSNLRDFKEVVVLNLSEELKKGERRLKLGSLFKSRLQV